MQSSTKNQLFSIQIEFPVILDKISKQTKFLTILKKALYLVWINSECGSWRALVILENIWESSVNEAGKASSAIQDQGLTFAPQSNKKVVISPQLL